MRFVRRWPIRTVFFAVALASLVPLLAGEMAHAILLMGEDRRLAEDLSYEAARSIAANVGRLVEDSKNHVRHVAQRPALAGRGREPVDEVLRELLEYEPRFAGTALFDSQGRLLASASRRKVRFSAFVARPAELEGMRAATSTFMSEPFRGRVSGRWVCTIGARVAGASAAPAAFVSASLDLVKVGELLSTFESIPQATVTIVSRKGSVVARVPESSAMIGRDISRTQLGRLVAAKADGRAVVAGLDGKSSLVGFTSIPAANWTVVVGVPEQAVLTAVRSRMLGRLATLLAGLIGGIALAAMASRSIARPIGDLQRATDAVARGQAGIAVPIDGPLEIRSVGRSFNRMVRKRAAAESALRESEHRFREFAGITPEVFFLYAVRERRFLYLSPRFNAIWGVDEAAAMNDPEVWFAAINESERAGLRAGFDAPDWGRESASTIRIRRPDGSERTVRVRLFRTPAEGGPQDRLAGTAEDLTPLVMLEDSLKRTERTSALGGVVAGLAHEIRGPLYGLKELIAAWAMRTTDHVTVERYLPHLQRELHHIGRLTTDLLDYGRDHRLTLLAIPAFPLLEAAAEAERAEALARNVTITLQFEGNPGTVQADRFRSIDLFANLIDNAVRLSPGGGTVTVIGRTVDEGGWLEVDVLDRGPGIGPDDLPHVFEPFFSRREGGTGVGLALVRRLVEDHGGSIAVANREGGGARFTVRLPGGST